MQNKPFITLPHALPPHPPQHTLETNKQKRKEPALNNKNPTSSNHICCVVGVARNIYLSLVVFLYSSGETVVVVVVMVEVVVVVVVEKRADVALEEVYVSIRMSIRR